MLYLPCQHRSFLTTFESHYLPRAYKTPTTRTTLLSGGVARFRFPLQSFSDFRRLVPARVNLAVFLELEAIGF
jgi:hypothetical protein